MSRRSAWRVLSLLMLVVCSCKTPETATLDADGDANLPLAVRTIDSALAYDAVSKEATGFIRGGRSVKFFVDKRNPESPQVYFINGNFKTGGTTPEYAKYHYYFAQKQLGLTEGIEEFNKVTYFSEDKRYMAGTVTTYKMPDTDGLIYGISFYPQDVIKGQRALTASRLIAKALNIPSAVHAFVATGSQQTTVDVETEFETAGIKLLTIDQILGTMRYIPMHEGEAWGYLRIFPANQNNITAKDIVVFDDLPLDLTVVAGTITKAFQDANSHVNLKSKERNTPNAVLRDASLTHEQLAPFKDKPVHMTVSNSGLRFEATTAAVIDTKLKERMNKPWLPISWDSYQTVTSYDNMCTLAADCLKHGRRFGSKAASLGFLAHRQVLGRVTQTGSFSNRYGYDLVPRGFGIPLQFYKDLVDFPANAALKQKLNELITKEKAGTLSVQQRVALLTTVQGLFFKAKFPPGNLQKIRQAMSQYLGGIDKVKVRSSANAEDIEGFDGAGLHDSYSAKPSEADRDDQVCVREAEEEGDDAVETKARMVPRTLACGIKGVYASMWNKRAIEERSFSRIDHATVSMGISVLPAYDYQSKVDANSVVVTRVINSADVYGYSLSVQDKNNLVTNPTPGTWSEVTIAAIGQGDEPTSLTVTRFAKPKRDAPQLTGPVLGRDVMLKMVDISKKVEEAYCRAKPGYYSGNCRFVALDVAKPKALDFEYKYLKNGQFVCKQVREFAGK